MRIILLLLIVGFCLVSAKYLPSETRDYNVLSRMKRSDDSDDSSSSVEHDKNLSESNTNGDDDDDDDISENQYKGKEQENKNNSKALERQEKEKRKQEEQQKKMEEKRAKEQRKEQEKREKEERKRLEKLEKEKRKEEEKKLKEEKKKQVIEEKQLKQLEKESFDKFEEDYFLETEEDSSVELADIWKNHIYVKYGLTLASTKIEKQAALQRYLQEVLGLSSNSTESERRQAIVQLIQTKLQGDAAERIALKNQLISHINAVSIQKLRTKLEKDLEDLNNKTQILSNVSLPWVSTARQNVEDKKSFLETITQFLSSILPNWVIGGQTVQNSNSDAPVISNGPSDAIAENSININSENSITQSSNSNAAQTGINAPMPNADKDSVSQSTIITSSSDATPINVNDNTINSSVSASDDSATGVNVSVTSTTSVDNSLPPSEEETEASVNDGNTSITGVIVESSTVDRSIASPNTEKSSTNESSTSIRDNVPSINISEDTAKNGNNDFIGEDGSILSNVNDLKVTSTNLNTDAPIGINSRPDGDIPNEVDKANTQSSPGGTLSSKRTEDTSNVSIDVVSPDVLNDTLTTKPDSASGNSISISSSTVGVNESPASSNDVSSGYSTVESANAVDNVVSSNFEPSTTDIVTPEDSVINNGGDKTITGGSTHISSESKNVVPATQNVVSFESNQAISSNNVDNASTIIPNSLPGASSDITSSPNAMSFESNKAFSSNSVNSESSITDNVSDNNFDLTISPDVASLEGIKTVYSNSLDDDKLASISNDVLDTSLGTTLRAADGKDVSLNVGSISMTDSSFTTGPDLGLSIASDFTPNKIDSISVDPAVNNTTLILVEPTTEVNEINSNIIASATGSNDNNNEIASSLGNTVPVHDEKTPGDVISVSVNDAATVISIGSTESNVMNDEIRNTTTVKKFDVTSAVEHVISEGSTNVNEISIQPLDTSSTVKAVETTIAPETNPVKPDGEASAQPLHISTANPVDSGLENEVVTTVSNTINNVNTVSASVETSSPSEKPMLHTSQTSLDNTVPLAELTTLKDGITIPVEEGASVVEILQQ